jgi:membrane protease YdiL (CAAX protease family)
MREMITANKFFLKPQFSCCGRKRDGFAWLGARWMCQNTAMPSQINRVSGIVIIILSLTALLAVLSGYTHPLLPDEGTAAHIFQLSIVALVPGILLFLATADWRQPWRSARPLALSGAALVFAFEALYYLEHYR